MQLCNWTKLFLKAEEKLGDRDLTSTKEIHMHGFIAFSFLSGLPAAIRSIHNLTVIRAHAGNNALLHSCKVPFT